MIGTWIKLPAVEVVELLAVAGLDFVIIDLEHGTINMETAAQMIGVARSAGLQPFVRVPAATAGYVQPILDAGATGIVVPHVDDAEEARGAVRAIRFPPMGARGASPSGRAGQWGTLSLADYLQGGDGVTVIAQIESMAALTAIDNIAAVPGIDAVFIGEADLAASSGLAVDHVSLLHSIEAAEETCRTAGLVLGGVAKDGVEAANRLGRGYQLLTISTDLGFLRGGAADAVTAARGSVAVPAHRPEPALPAGILHDELLAFVTAVWFEIDHTDGTGVSGHFTDDATLTIDRATSHGTAEIDALYAGRNARGPRVSRHCVTNLHVVEVDPTSVRAVSALLLFAEDGEAPRRRMSPVLVADVDDIFVRRDGRWLIQRRHIRPQFLPEEGGLAVPTE
jgi:2-keto-3-deoxy-L-rhamnonate aldolase RhmA